MGLQHPMHPHIIHFNMPEHSRGPFPEHETSFSVTGLNLDAGNVWTGVYALALLNKFEAIEPVRDYRTYFEGQDEKYEKKGRPGLLPYVLGKSNPDTVLAFDLLVERFNNDLPQIKKERNTQAIEDYVESYKKLNQPPPEEVNS